MSALASPCLAMAVRPRGLAISPPSRPATLGRVSPPSLRTPSRCSAPSRAQVIARANAQDNDVPWRVQWLALNENDVPTIEPEEAMRMVTAGEAVIVDVRVPADFDKSHALDAVNVPLFKRVDIFNTDLKGLMRFAVYSLNGVTAVEPNKDFTEQVVKAANGKAVILYCEAGGTMEPTPNFLYGKESRSLRGAYKLVIDGRITKVAHLSGGLYQWFKDGFELVGEFDSSNLGRTPNAAPTATVFEESPK